MKIAFRCRILLCVSVNLTLFSSCFTIQPVEFKKAENITTNRTDSDFVMTLELAMHNPNNWSIRLSEVETDILIDNMQLGKARLSKSVRLKRNSDFMLPVNAVASLGDLVKLSGLGITLLFGNQNATATIKGNMVLKKFIFRRKVQFEYKQTIDGKVLQSWF
jgi:LEA14-like dessication related protein